MLSKLLSSALVHGPMCISLTSNQIFNGVQFDFVNAGTGNLTFLRRDMVASGRVPLVLARVYDSSGQGSTEFGPGWKLSAAETIVVAEGRAHLFSENGSVIDFVQSGESAFQLEKDYPSDYSTLLSTADTIKAAMRSGLLQEFSDGREFLPAGEGYRSERERNPAGV